MVDKSPYEIKLGVRPRWVFIKSLWNSNKTIKGEILLERPHEICRELRKKGSQGNRSVKNLRSDKTIK